MKSALQVNKEYSNNYKQELTEYKIPSMIEHFLNNNVHLVDLGCGDGRLIASIKKKFPKMDVVGVDISDKRIKKLEKQFPNDLFLCEDVCYTSLLEESFDVVCCEQTIEHVENDNQLIEEIVRVLKLGGYVYITSVIKHPLAFYKYRNRKGKIVLDPTHEKEYKSKKEFLELFKKVGYAVKEKNHLHNFEYFQLLDIKLTPVRRKLFNIHIPIFGYYIIECLFTTTY